ncbi:hypothetical protein SUGI_1497080 [Cryptomeria japonica]|uniref:Uncharacterized protein n=1 Tax=Cryptomeria japonica TaxID=3369 RepID=A0AAD3NRT5_CRYJA|nr:hypothetical protein SUGI_1472410 [Cryptomeria japonica]GLJ59193.1 hypothetical protein SUGI_1497080 [Cryptomeria japonica]
MICINGLRNHELVIGQYRWTTNMKWIIKAKALHGNILSSYISMEINLDNAIMEELQKKVEVNNNVKDLMLRIFETVLLTSSFSLDNAKPL